MNKYQLLDHFAGLALSALITKMPFYDSKGEFGKVISEEELQEIKKNLTDTAYEYASWMLIAQEKSYEWIDINDKSKIDHIEDRK